LRQIHSGELEARKAGNEQGFRRFQLRPAAKFAKRIGRIFYSWVKSIEGRD
jgi:hypothetical protein